MRRVTLLERFQYLQRLGNTYFCHHFSAFFQSKFDSEAMVYRIIIYSRLDIQICFNLAIYQSVVTSKTLKDFSDHSVVNFISRWVSFRVSIIFLKFLFLRFQIKKISAMCSNKVYGLLSNALGNFALILS